MIKIVDILLIIDIVLYNDVIPKKNYRADRLSKEEARKLVAFIVYKGGEGSVMFTDHARKELNNDRLNINDALNTLKSSSSQIYSDGEFENESYRYRLKTRKIVIVFSFNPSGEQIIVITCWRDYKNY